MIVEEGFKGMSMQKLAKAANISPATIYLYYQDRSDLLNKLYLEILNRTNEAALRGFDPTMSFEEGLQVLWLNRFHYYSQHPTDFFFIEQFINSPLIRAVAGLENQTYRSQMQAFHANAIAKGEIQDLPLEIYWSVAYAPLYQLIRFHLQETVHPKPKLVINEGKLLTTLALTTKALKS